MHGIRGYHHNTLALKIAESMGSQWAASDATPALILSIKRYDPQSLV